MDEKRLMQIIEDNFRLLELNNREQNARFQQMAEGQEANGQVAARAADLAKESIRLSQESIRVSSQTADLSRESAELSRETAKMARAAGETAERNADAIAGVLDALRLFGTGTGELRQRPPTQH